AKSRTVLRSSGSKVLDHPAVIGPVQQSLPLPWTAKRIARLAVHFDLFDVATKRLPALDLPSVLFQHPPAHVIAAVPLKPPARIIVMNPPMGGPPQKGAP